MGEQATYWGYWGKTGSEWSPLGYHPLACHSLDVAAVCHALLARDTGLRGVLARTMGLPPGQIQAWCTFLVSLHDLGKFAEAFQQLSPELLHTLQSKTATRGYQLKHDTLGLLLWSEYLARDRDVLALFLNEVSGSRSERMVLSAVKQWLAAAMGHHGQPPHSEAAILAHHFAEQDTVAAREYLLAVAGILLTDAAPLQSLMAPSDAAQRDRAGGTPSSWALAGLTVLCDWIGSNAQYFGQAPARASLAEYWPIALERAESAVSTVGVLPATAAPSPNPHELFPDIAQWSPLQSAASTLELGAGPQLFLLEDVTGSGKTEAAMILAGRLLSVGAADGLYYALPTMATANAMYSRVAQCYRHLFDAGPVQPSLILAHSARMLSGPFRNTLQPEHQGTLKAYAADELEIDAQCTTWLADNRKKALLAQVGVGTIDQALQAILPVRHQSLRMMGLLRKILIVDEVHAFDPYMLRLLSGLLAFHGSMGGSAILLSATLPASVQEQLLRAYGGEVSTPGAAGTVSYPLITRCGSGQVEQLPVDPAPSSCREVAVSFIETEAAVVSLLAQEARRGKAVCWVRNTVADATAGWEALRATLGDEEATLFHARFAMGDRLAMEDRVLATFGKASTAKERAGRFLVATQVVEQSLDLDFDVLVTDLCPIDLILQRAGRLHRHRRNKSGTPLAKPTAADQREPPTLHIHAPALTTTPDAEWFSAHFPGAAHVYPMHGQLWLAAKMLAERGRYRLPDDMRSLIEGVYGSAAGTEIPAALGLRDRRAEGEAKAAGTLAAFNMLNLQAGYSQLGFSTTWTEDRFTPTRLAEPSVTLRLARWDAGMLQPWCMQGAYPWALSEVTARASRVAAEAPTPEPALRQAIATAIATMPDRGRFSLLIPLSPASDGNWQGNALDPKGQPVRLSYSSTRGLILSTA